MEIGRGVILASVGVIAVVGFMSLDRVGTAVLHRGVDGPNCPVPHDVEGINFHSAFNSENTFISGTKIRARSGDGPVECTRVGASYRCEHTGPTIIEVTRVLNASRPYYYEIPAEVTATVIGEEDWVWCHLTSPAGSDG